MAVNDNSETNEKRLQSLEHASLEIHRLLALVQNKLLGSLETDNCGLINDFRALQTRVNKFEVELVEVKQGYVQQNVIATLRQELVVIKDVEISSIQKSVEALWQETSRGSKFRWMITGGLIVINTALGLYVALKH